MKDLFFISRRKKVTTIPSWLAHDEPMIHLFFFSLSPIEQTATYFHFYPFPFLQRHYCNGGGWGVCNAFKSRLSLSLSAPCSPFLLFLKKSPPSNTHTRQFMTGVFEWSFALHDQPLESTPNGKPGPSKVEQSTSVGIVECVTLGS